MKTSILVQILIGALMGAIVGTMFTVSAHSDKIRDTQAALVYSICNQSRQEINGTSEEICGELQNRLNIEFLCTQRNMLPTNKCWTEAK